MENSLIFVQSFASFAFIAGVIKSIDWLILTKYKTKDECEKCRNDIFDLINKDRDLLVKLDTKMDMVLERIKENDYES